jgi:hypothetical protein
MNILNNHLGQIRDMNNVKSVLRKRRKIKYKKGRTEENKGYVSNDV